MYHTQIFGLSFERPYLMISLNLNLQISMWNVWNTQILRWNTRISPWNVRIPVKCKLKCTKQPILTQSVILRISSRNARKTLTRHDNSLVGVSSSRFPLLYNEKIPLNSQGFANFQVYFSHFFFNMTSADLGFPHFFSHCTAGGEIWDLQNPG